MNLAVSCWQAGWWSRALRIDSPNFGERPIHAQIDLLVIHSISLPPGVYGGPEIEALFTNQLESGAHPYFAQIRDIKVSSHFVIRRDGGLLQFVSCDKRAWHAGASHYRGRDNCNDDSIGIELEGLEGELFESAQYDTLFVLCTELVNNYPIAHIAGHEDIAPGRKLDPGAGFDWQLLQEKLILSNSFFPPARLGKKLTKKII
ncbi:MAG: 1,6-anhydro-N-acetylmuramyl-L-alanine amidase AmpD [Betaproteobacteria bacterium]